MKKCLLLMAALVFVQLFLHAKVGATLKMLVGTYTADTNSQGVYYYHFNQETGEVTLQETVMVENPTFLTLSAPIEKIYAVAEMGNGKSGVNVIPFAGSHFSKPSFFSNEQDNKAGGAPCNIWTDGIFLVTANYTGGSVSIYRIQADSVNLYQVISFPGLFPGKVSHIHQALPTPDGKYLLVTDLGNDCLYRFTINGNASDGAPYLTDQRILYHGFSGCGPRHFTFSKDGKYMYLINELGGTLVSFLYENGYSLPLQEIMAEEVEAHGSADIHLSPDGKYLYASHRLKNDGVSVYRVNKTTGRVKKVGYQHTAPHPRNFAITPNGKYLLAACRDGNCIEIYQRNKRTGLLTKTSQVTLPKPMMVLCF